MECTIARALAALAARSSSDMVKEVQQYDYAC